jgi:hypothetical protein
MPAVFPHPASGVVCAEKPYFTVVTGYLSTPVFFQRAMLLM